MAEHANDTQPEPKKLKSSSRILLETYGEQLGYTTGWGNCQQCTPQSDSGVRCCAPSLGELDRLKRIAQDNPDMMRRIQSLRGKTELQDTQLLGKAQKQIASFGDTIIGAFNQLGGEIAGKARDAREARDRDER